MEKLKKEIISNCAKTLMDSTVAGFDSGYLDDWTKWARKMRDTIKAVVPQLEALANNIPDTVSAQPTDKEVEAWFKENVTEDCSASSAIYKFRLYLKDRELASLK